MKTKTKAVCAALMLAFCAGSLSACSNGGQTSVAAEKTVSMYDLQTAMLAAADSLPDMTSVNGSSENAESLLAYVSDIDYSKVQDYFIAYAKDGSASADEIAVIALKDAADVSTAVDSLNRHVTDRKNLYSQYGPELAAEVDDAQVFSNGRYAVLIISADRSKMKSEFEKFING